MFPLANEYVTAEELKASLELTGETYADSDVELALSAASRGIDRETRRRFWLDANATQVRYYTPSEAGKLAIDDLVSLTSLKTDDDADGSFENTWASTDYVLLPLNAAADDRPHTTIARVPGGTYRFPAGALKSVQVTGKFGWPAVPDEIKAATTIVASKLLRRVREAPFGVVGVGIDGGAVRITRHDPDVKFLIGPFTRNTAGSVKLG